MRYISLLPVLLLFIFIVSCTNENDGSLETQVQKTENDQIFSAERVSELTKMPEYSGGMEELAKFLGSVIVYPEEAKKDGFSGRVLVSFVVGTDGKVRDAKVKQGIHPLLDAEALRAINKMPNWTPGIYDGKNVAVELILPVQFRLE